MALSREFPDLPRRVRTRLIPGVNDGREQLSEIVQFLRRRLSPCCGRKRHKGPTSRARNCYPNRYGEGKYRQLGQATLAENPIRRSVWRNSRPFSRPGARRD